MYARWIPHSLTEEQKLKRVEGAENDLREINGNVIIIDEKWLHCKSLPPKPYNKVRQIVMVNDHEFQEGLLQIGSITLWLLQASVETIVFWY